MDEIEAGARFLRAFQKYRPVQSAFWLRDSDEYIPRLYVASEQITDDNFDEAYGEVLQVAGEIRDPLFDPFQVRLIGADDPLAKAAREIQARYPGRSPLRFRDKVIGGQFAEEAYLYPSPIPETPA
jgi:hypothetical protein